MGVFAFFFNGQVVSVQPQYELIQLRLYEKKVKK